MLEVFLLSNSLEDIFNSFEYCEVQSYNNLSIVCITCTEYFSNVDYPFFKKNKFDNFKNRKITSRKKTITKKLQGRKVSAFSLEP